MTASGYIFQPSYSLLDFLLLSAVAVFRVDDFRWEWENRPLDSLNSPHTLCPCHFIDRLVLFLFPPLSTKLPHFSPLSLQRAEWWFSETSARYLEANVLAGLQWVLEHRPLLAFVFDQHVHSENGTMRDWATVPSICYILYIRFLQIPSLACHPLHTTSLLERNCFFFPLVVTPLQFQLAFKFISGQMFILATNITRFQYQKPRSACKHSWDMCLLSCLFVSLIKVSLFCHGT